MISAQGSSEQKPTNEAEELQRQNEELRRRLAEAEETLRVIKAAHDPTDCRKSELRLQALMNALPVGISFSDDPACRRIIANRAALAQFEMMTRDNHSASTQGVDTAGRKVRFFFEGREITDAELPLQKAVAENREIAPMELEVVLPSGRRWFAEASGAPVRDILGNIIGGVAVTEDISERKKAEEQLRKAHDELEQKVRERTDELHKINRTLRMTSECSQLLIRAADEEELIREICRIIVDLGGYRMIWVGYAEDNQEKTIRPVVSITGEESDPKNARIGWADNRQGSGPTGDCIRTGKVCIGHDFLNDPDLAPWKDDALKLGFRSSIALPLMRRGKPFGVLSIYSKDIDVFDEGQVSVLRDLADDLAFGIVALRAQAERDQALQTAENRAKQLNALAIELVQVEQKERLRLARILHDHLQQLLVGAKFGASIIQARADSTDIQRSAEQLAATLNEAINVSRSLSADLSPPILHEKGLKAGLMWLSRQMLEKYSLTVEVSADEGAEPASEQVRLFLFDAVRELLLNIVKHAKVDRAEVHMRTLETGEVEVTVSDRGVGFEPGQLGVPSSAAGGFGLFGICERLSFLGGSMAIEASPGRGSRFTLAAPARTESSSKGKAETSGKDPSGAAGQQAGSTNGVLLEIERKIRVLIADDHPIVRQGLERLLEELAEIEVVGEAGDGQRAIDLAQQLRPDVILMDISLPVINGLDATKQINSRQPGIRIIGLSMHEESDMAEAMRKAGAVAYMTKGGPTEQLIAAIRGSLKQRPANKTSAAGRNSERGDQAVR